MAHRVLPDHFSAQPVVGVQDHRVARCVNDLLFQYRHLFDGTDTIYADLLSPHVKQGGDITSVNI